MVRTSSVALIASAFAVTSGEVSCNGHCTDTSAESTAILQHKRALTKLTKQQAQSSTQVTDLLQSATQLLKSGATPDVIQFTQDILTDLRNDVVPAIMDAHDKDVRSLADALGRFDQIKSQHEENQRALEPLHSAVQIARDNHNGCREEQKDHCQQAEECEAERQRLEDVLVQERGQYKTVMQRIGTQYCMVEHDHTAIDFREFSASNFQMYLKDGRAMIQARQAHDAQRDACKGLNEVLRSSKEDCDEKKKALEHASCSVHHARFMASDYLDTAWALAAENFNELKATVQTLQQHRVAELTGLKQIECIVEELYTRGGKPCDEDANEADEIAADCARAGDDVSSLDIHFPETPEKVSFLQQHEAEESDPHPCDSTFLAKEYGHLTGICFNDIAECNVCAEDPLLQPYTQAPAATCDTYACPDIYVAKPNPFGISRLCTGPVCDAATCCDLKAHASTCDTFTCPATHVAKTSPMPQPCVNQICDIAACCELIEAPAATCDTYACPDMYVAKPNPFGISRLCMGPVCDAATCCDLKVHASTCDEFTCPESHVAKTILTPQPCVNQICDIATCCDLIEVSTYNAADSALGITEILTR